MTSDTKVGLLLGLVFIFFIAFLINGLPSFSTFRGNDLSEGMMGQRPMGLAMKEREAHERITPKPYVQNKPNPNPILAAMEFDIPQRDDGPRVTMDLAGVGSAGDSVSSQGYDIRDGILKAVQSVRDFEPLDDESLKLKSQKDLAQRKPYTVRENDTLTKIAILHYGKQEGNRLVNVNRIFDANRNRLKSPDSLALGQRILIPPLPSEIPSSLEKVVLPVKRPEKTLPAKLEEYRVQEGDNLSKIAANLLGSANRYLELAQLNKDRLADEDSLEPGMLLRIP